MFQLILLLLGFRIKIIELIFEKKNIFSASFRYRFDMTPTMKTSSKPFALLELKKHFI